MCIVGKEEEEVLSVNIIIVRLIRVTMYSGYRLQLCGTIAVPAFSYCLLSSISLYFIQCHLEISGMCLIQADGWPNNVRDNKIRNQEETSSESSVSASIVL